MCVIILQPKGAFLTKDRAERLWKVNPDGGGFSFVNDEGNIETWKAMDFKPFWKRFAAARAEFPDSDYLIHFRIATHGTVDLNNVHPFVIDDANVVAHNGVIHKVPLDPEKKKSDTAMFVTEILPQLPELWLDSLLLSEMVEEWVGWSKLAFLTINPDLEYPWYLLNERKGNWIDKMWFSSMNGVNLPTKWEIEAKKRTQERLDAANAAAKAYREGKPPLYVVGKAPGDKKEFREHIEGKPMTYSEPPGGEGWVPFGGESEASARARWDEEMWNEELDMDLAEYAKIAIPLGTSSKDLQTFLGEEEALYFLDLLTEEREGHGLRMQIMWNPDDGGIDCYGCDEEVDLENGQCQCWDKFCLDCERIAGLCECKDGYSSNLKLWSELKGEK